MEEKNQSEQRGSERKKSHNNRRRRKNNNANKQHAEQKGLANGGYSKQNQSGGSHSSLDSASGQNRRSNRSGRSKDRAGFTRDREPKRVTGYQPDNSKEAIRTFDLGTCDDAGKLMAFHFDKGTYTIAERKELETVKREDGTEEIRYEETEVLSTRDKLAAYKAWNEIKRPKKGKNGREKKEEESGGKE